MYLAQHKEHTNWLSEIRYKTFFAPGRISKSRIIIILIYLHIQVIGRVTILLPINRWYYHMLVNLPSSDVNQRKEKQEKTGNTH